MPKTAKPAHPETGADQLVWLAEMLSLDLDEEDLSALAEQLRAIEALEQAELADFPPMLSMDADWYE